MNTLTIATLILKIMRMKGALYTLKVQTAHFSIELVILKSFQGFIKI